MSYSDEWGLLLGIPVNPRAAKDGFLVRVRPGVEDGVGGALDPVGHTCGIEDENVTSLLAIKGELGDLEAAQLDGFSVVRPRGGGVVDRIAVARDLHP